MFVVLLSVCGGLLSRRLGVLGRWSSGECWGGVWEDVVDCGRGNYGRGWCWVPVGLQVVFRRNAGCVRCRKEGKSCRGSRVRLGSEFRVVLEVFQPLVRRGSKRLNSGVSGWISGEETVSLLLGIASPIVSPLWMISHLSPDPPPFSFGFFLLKFWLLAGLSVAN